MKRTTNPYRGVARAARLVERAAGPFAGMDPATLTDASLDWLVGQLDRAIRLVERDPQPYQPVLEPLRAARRILAERDFDSDAAKRLGAVLAERGWEQPAQTIRTR